MAQPVKVPTKSDSLSVVSWEPHDGRRRLTCRLFFNLDACARAIVHTPLTLTYTESNLKKQVENVGSQCLNHKTIKGSEQ